MIRPPGARQCGGALIGWLWMTLCPACFEMIRTDDGLRGVRKEGVPGEGCLKRDSKALLDVTMPLAQFFIAA